MEVIVVGAGPIGLAVTAALRAQGCEVRIYDGAPRPPAHGGVMQLHSEGIAALKILMGSEFVADMTRQADSGIVNEVHVTDLRHATPENPAGKPLHTVNLLKRYGRKEHLVVVRRQTLFAMLHEALAAHQPIYNKNVQNLEENGANGGPGNRVTVTFADGTSDHADLVVAVDGPSSFIRQLLFPGTAFQPVDMRCIGGIASCRLKNKDTALITKLMNTKVLHAGYSPDVRILTCQCDATSFGWYLLFPEPYQERSAGKIDLVNRALEQANALSSSGDSIIHALVRATPTNGPDAFFTWQSGDIAPLKSYTKGHVVLMGDAAHCMISPNALSQGVNQGFGDAAVLVNLVKEELHRKRQSKTDGLSGNWSVVLQSYSRHRVFVASEFQAAFRKSHVPFGAWPFQARIVLNDNFLDNMLAPFDKITRNVVEEVPEDSSTEDTQLMLTVVGLVLVAAVAGTVWLVIRSRN